MSDAGTLMIVGTCSALLKKDSDHGGTRNKKKKGKQYRYNEFAMELLGDIVCLPECLNILTQTYSTCLT